MIRGAVFAAAVCRCGSRPAEEVAVTVHALDLDDVLLFRIQQRCRPRPAFASPELQFGNDHASSSNGLRLQRKCNGHRLHAGERSDDHPKALIPGILQVYIKRT